jgi:ParB/RepB/Spo0J family partition protein
VARASAERIDVEVAEPQLLHVHVALIDESRTNPRRVVRDKHFEDLIRSVRQWGVLEPVILRPVRDRYELVAGHRRVAAAREAEIDQVPATVRDLGDREVLEIQLIENIQRADLHPLEEAEGYRQLMHVHKYDVSRIAERLGRSVKYVYDRVKLLSLTKECQTLFLDDRITAGHAVIIARLKPADQARVLDLKGVNKVGASEAPLFHHERTLFTPEQRMARPDRKANPYEGLKTRSVRELQAWVDKNVRFDARASDLPDLFPETHQAVTAAKEAKERIVHITYDHHVVEEARTAERVYGPLSWVRVGEKPCEHAVTGVIVIGPGRGEAFKVCIEKEKCKTHWAKWQKERARNRRAVERESSTGEARQEAQQRKWKEAEARRRAEDARRDKARPAIMKAIAEKVEKAPAGSTSQVAEAVVGSFRQFGGAMSELVPRGKTVEDLLRHLAYNWIVRSCRYDWNSVLKWAKAFKVDAKKILNEAAPAPKEEKPAEPKVAARRVAKPPRGKRPRKRGVRK